MANGLQSVKDEQEYIVLRERVHRNTAESTNDRVKWWSIIQAIVLFAVVAWQIYYLKVFIQTNVVYPLKLIPAVSPFSKSSAPFDPLYINVTPTSIYCCNSVSLVLYRAIVTSAIITDH